MCGVLRAARVTTSSAAATAVGPQKEHVGERVEVQKADSDEGQQRVAPRRVRPAAREASERSRAPQANRELGCTTVCGGGLHHRR